MDRETLSHYGWIVVLILILSVMMALATPLGQFIADGFKATYVGFGNVNDNALGIFGQTISGPAEVKYYQPYRAEFDWGTVEYVFHKDGAVDVYNFEEDYNYGSIYESGSAVYKEGTIELDGIELKISDDGTVLNAEAPGGEKATFTLIPTPIKPLQMGVEYVCIDGEWEYVQTFNADGSGAYTEYDDGELTNSYDIPTGEFKYFDQHFEDHYYDEYDGQTYIERCAVYPNGTKIILFGYVYEIECSHINTEVRNDREYCTDCGKLIPIEVEYYQPYIGTYSTPFNKGHELNTIEVIFHKDGGVDVYHYDFINNGETHTAGSVKYEDGMILDGGAEMAFNILDNGKTLSGEFHGNPAILKLVPIDVRPMHMNEQYSSIESEDKYVRTYNENGSGTYAYYSNGTKQYETIKEEGIFEYCDEYFMEKLYNGYYDRYYTSRRSIHPSGMRIIHDGRVYRLDCSHTSTIIINKEDGVYSGDKLCTNCGEIIEFGTTTPAYAIYTESNKTLWFIRAETEPQIGDLYNGAEITNVYKDIETSIYEKEDSDTEEYIAPWNHPICSDSSVAANIEKVIVVDKIRPISTRGWFAYCSNCGYYDLEKLDTSLVGDMSYMFSGAGTEVESFTIIGIENWNTSALGEVYRMFFMTACNATDVSEINFNKWNPIDIYQSYFTGTYTDMFAYHAFNRVGLDTVVVDDRNLFLGR